jgi:hypothetical protein
MTSLLTDILARFFFCVFIWVLFEGTWRGIAMLDDLLTERDRVH